MYPMRTGLIIWVSDLKHIKQLDKIGGTIHYISRKMHYVVMYVNSDRTEETTKSLLKLPFVKKVERSYRDEIPTEYSSKAADPAQEPYQIGK